MKAIITVGISGSGKSTWADKIGWVNINRDDMRWLISGNNGWSGDNAYKFNSVVEDAVTSMNKQRIIEAMYDGRNIVISDTNLNQHFRKKLIKELLDMQYEVEIREFPISFQEACRRDKERGIFAVGEAVLTKQWGQWIKYNEEKGGTW